MEEETKLPFKVGELAEARTFENGFRGAWFRCEIREITERNGDVVHVLEYYDYPEEELEWMEIFQVPPHYVKAKEKHRELMLRPHYPPIYNEKQMPDVSTISEVTVIVDNNWQVGDLVDWWTTESYWSGRITQLLGDDKAQIELKQPPLGEGQFYEVHLKDIRPSLDWSPESGWTVPVQEGGTGRSCARLINPINQVNGGLGTIYTHNAGQQTEAVQVTAGPSAALPFSSPVTSNSLAVSDNIQEKSMSEVCGDSGTRKTSRADTDSGQTSAEGVAKEGLNSSCSLKKNSRSLNSTRTDTLEGAILDLEEYVNKVKWLKAILQYGISSSDAPKPQWEFVDPK